MTVRSNPGFVHLHVHTEYSLVDGLTRINPLVTATAEAGMPAVAVTEHDNLFSVVKFYRAATSRGVKPIIGVDAAVSNMDGASEGVTRLVLLCQDIAGYRRLTKLVSRAYIEGQTQHGPVISREWLTSETEGLIALSGAQKGDIGQALMAERESDAKRCLAFWRELFDDRFYIELQRTGREDEEHYLDGAVGLAIDSETPVVATNDVMFIAPGDYEAHEARVCIHDGRTLADPRRVRRYAQTQYLRTPQEMAEVFHDLPEALENTVEIAKRCNVELTLGVSVLPEFPVPPGEQLETWFERQSTDGLQERLEHKGKVSGFDIAANREPYDQRLQRELKTINQMGYPGYFLIVADFIRWARENGVPVGPGRGSGAGSLVAFALGITDIDPLEFDLLFERFLNPERVDMPDFDIDFCMDGRDRVIDYVTQTYGGESNEGERVSQIITFGTMAAKAVVRDVGRVLGHPYGFVDQLAKLIPFELGMTLDRALEDEALSARYAEDDEVRMLIDLARKLEGLVRNAGRHAGGVVIAPSPLTDFTGLYCERGARGVVTQLDKGDVEAVGLVKFDFLGLRTLTIIDKAVATIDRINAQKGEPALDITALGREDASAYDLIKTGHTTAVFQLESRGMKDLIRRLQPDCFDDVIALVALFRPGPLQSGMVDDFIDRKHGRELVVYPHPALEPILSPTYGVILYQEQVMQIAQVLAGYTLGGADLLRRAMGKKKPEEMAKQREIFVQGAVERDVDEDQATYIFDLMEKFAGYGFNKSHSAAYALVSYQTAWLKASYPAPFMAAVLSADMDNTDKVVTLIAECRALKLDLQAPSINDCQHEFTVHDDGSIRYGLGAVKGVGESAIESLIEERETNGQFEDLYAFCRRIDSRKVNRRVVECLIRCGALDELGPSRASMMTSLTHALHIAEQHARDTSVGQHDMFGGVVASPHAQASFADVEEWDEEERLRGEKDTLGHYLSGHPVARFADELAKLTTAKLAELRPGTGTTVTAGGLIMSIRTINSRKGRMAVLTLDDSSAWMDVVVYAEFFQRYRDLLIKDTLVVVEGEISEDEFTGRYSMVVDKVFDLQGAREMRARSVLIRIRQTDLQNGLSAQLVDLLGPYRNGRTPVCIAYSRVEAQARVPLGDNWRVEPSEELLGRLRDLVGPERVSVEY